MIDSISTFFSGFFVSGIIIIGGSYLKQKIGIEYRISILFPVVIGLVIGIFANFCSVIARYLAVISGGGLLMAGVAFLWMYRSKIFLKKSLWITALIVLPLVYISAVFVPKSEIIYNKHFSYFWAPVAELARADYPSRLRISNYYPLEWGKFHFSIAGVYAVLLSIFTKVKWMHLVGAKAALLLALVNDTSRRDISSKKNELPTLLMWIGASFIFLNGFLWHFQTNGLLILYFSAIFLAGIKKPELKSSSFILILLSTTSIRMSWIWPVALVLQAVHLHRKKEKISYSFVLCAAISLIYLLVTVFSGEPTTERLLMQGVSMGWTRAAFLFTPIIAAKELMQYGLSMPILLKLSLFFLGCFVILRILMTRKPHPIISNYGSWKPVFTTAAIASQILNCLILLFLFVKTHSFSDKVYLCGGFIALSLVVMLSFYLFQLIGVAVSSLLVSLVLLMYLFGVTHEISGAFYLWVTDLVPNILLLWLWQEGTHRLPFPTLKATTTRSLSLAFSGLVLLGAFLSFGSYWMLQPGSVLFPVSVMKDRIIAVPEDNKLHDFILFYSGERGRLEPDENIMNFHFIPK